jgi:hypothetical protein
MSYASHRATTGARGRASRTRRRTLHVAGAVQMDAGVVVAGALQGASAAFFRWVARRLYAEGALTQQPPRCQSV